MVLVSKFLLHQPLNRQSATYAREGIDLDVSTLADRVGACVVALDPIIQAIRAHVLNAERIHADDTTVPVLAKLKTVTGRIWTYVRDDRPFGGKDPPAAMLYYSRNRVADHPRDHLAGYAGIMQADAFAGFNGLYDAKRQPAPIIEAACWSHGRRKFFELATLSKSPIAAEAVRRIDDLFEIERTVNGKTPVERVAVRQERAKPFINDLKVWMRQQRDRLSPSNDLTKAINYILSRWVAFTRFLDDGRICLSNNAAERALRGVAVGRKNWTFAGSDDGASYCPSDNLLINQADFAADREMTGVETCGFWRPAECLHVRYLSPEQAMARRGMDDQRAGHLRRSCAVPWIGLRSTPEPLRRASSHHARYVPRPGRSQFRVDGAMNRQLHASSHFRAR
jgi:transposase